MINRKLFILVFFSLFAAAHGWSQLDSVASRLVRAVKSNKEERAYISTDRSFYGPGEKIWFRSFLINAYSRKLTSKDPMLFVDLVNEKDSVIERALVQASQFKTDGNFVLSDTIPTGFYWVRAYTRSLAWNHPEHIAIQPVYVFNPVRSPMRNNNSNTGAAILPSANSLANLRMDFYPEGGAVVSGANTVIAVRVTDAYGNPQQVAGVVKDDHDSVVANFQSSISGLGKLSFFSWSWRSYSMHVITGEKQAKIFALPKVDPFAAQLAIVDNKGIKKLRVVLEDSVYKKGKRTYIIGLSGDSLCFAGIGTGSYEVIIPAYRFPAGVAHFLLFDEQQRLLSERNLFIPGNKLRVELNADKPQYAARQKVQLNISVADDNNEPVVASLFVKVTDSVLAARAYPLRNAALQPEEVNGWTLLDQSFNEDELDLLLLTQKSASPPLDRTGLNPVKQTGLPETDSSFYIKGTVMGRNGKPLRNRIVTLFTGTGYMLALVDTTDDRGIFCFPLLSYYDQTKFKLQVTDSKRIPEEVTIELDTLFRFPLVVTPAYLKQKFSVEGIKEFYTAQRRRSLQDTIMMGKEWLKEVIVRTTIKKPAEYNRDRRISSFSKILTGKMLQDGGSNNLANAIFRIPGITLRDGFLVLRGGGGSFQPTSASEPLLIVDGVAITPYGSGGNINTASPLLNYLSTLDFRIIDFIEVLSGPEAAFFGTRAFNGVILIHTKKTQTETGDPATNGIHTIAMYGYQVPVVFEQPDYSIKEIKNDKLPDRRSLLYWNGDVITDEKGKVSLSFYTADIATRYYVSITGITADGRVVNKQISIARSN